MSNPREIYGNTSSINTRQSSQNGSGNVGRVTTEPERDDIPKVFFDEALPQTKDDAAMSFRYISKTKDISGYCKTKAQGTSSMSYPKKNQTVKLYRDAQCTQELNVNFRGWGEQNKFCLKANYIDHSHARNIISARLWGEVVASRNDYASLPVELRNSPNNGAVDGFPVKLYANGEYQGIYTMNIPKDAWMANMDEDNPNHIVLCAETNTDGVFGETPCNFRALWDGVDENHWSVEVGANSDAVKNSLNALISCVRDTDDDTFMATIGNYLDVQSAIDYFIHQYVICGLDGLAKNMLLYTYDGTKWFCGAYDMDSTFGLWWNGTSFVSAKYRCPEDYQERYSLLWERITNLYSEEITARYNELRTTVYSYANMVTRFERFTDTITRDLYTEDTEVYPNIPSADTNNINQIRGYIRDRLEYCDSRLSTVVPNEYTVVTFVQSDGRQYIDTGISGGTNAEYEILFDPSTTTAVEYEQYFGGDAKTAVSKLYHNRGDNTVQAQSTQINNGISLSVITLDDKYCRGRIWKFSFTKDGKFKRFDSVEGEAANAGFGWGANSWYIFANHVEGLMSSMRLYGLKMWTDGELVRDFVPVVRNSDNVAGLYDTVSGRFFESETDTALTAFTGLDSEYRPSTAIPSGYTELVLDENSAVAIPDFNNNPSGENGMTLFETVIQSEIVVAPDIFYDAGRISQANYVAVPVIYSVNTWNGKYYLAISLPTDIVGKTLDEVKAWLSEHHIVFYVETPGTQGGTYTQVSYVESHGSEVIDTGISGGTNASYEMKMAVCEGSVAWANLVSGGVNGHLTIFISDPPTNVMQNLNTGDYWLTFETDREDKIVTYDGSTGTLNYGGQVKSNSARIGDGWGDSAFTVMGGCMKLYYLKMYTNGIPVRDFVPVKRSDNVYCLYDKVSGEFFAPASGALTGA